MNTIRTRSKVTMDTDFHPEISDDAETKYTSASLTVISFGEFVMGKTPIGYRAIVTFFETQTRYGVFIELNSEQQIIFGAFEMQDRTKRWTGYSCTAVVKAIKKSRKYARSSSYSGTDFFGLTDIHVAEQIEKMVVLESDTQISRLSQPFLLKLHDCSQETKFAVVADIVGELLQEHIPKEKCSATVSSFLNALPNQTKHDMPDMIGELCKTVAERPESIPKILQLIMVEQFERLNMDNPWAFRFRHETLEFWQTLYFKAGDVALRVLGGPKWRAEEDDLDPKNFTKKKPRWNIPSIPSRPTLVRFGQKNCLANNMGSPGWIKPTAMKKAAQNVNPKEQFGLVTDLRNVYEGGNPCVETFLKTGSFVGTTLGDHNLDEVVDYAHSLKKKQDEATRMMKLVNEFVADPTLEKKNEIDSYLDGQIRQLETIVVGKRRELNQIGEKQKNVFIESSEASRLSAKSVILKGIINKIEFEINEYGHFVDLSHEWMVNQLDNIVIGDYVALERGSFDAGEHLKDFKERAKYLIAQDQFVKQMTNPENTPQRDLAWFLLRQCRATASRIFRIVTKVNPKARDGSVAVIEDSILEGVRIEPISPQNVCDADLLSKHLRLLERRAHLANEAMQHGTESEPNAVLTILLSVIPYLQASGKLPMGEYTFTETGIGLLGSLIGASSDGRISIGGHKINVEIKSPWKQGACVPSETISHEYMFQIQCQMEVLDLSSTLFISWGELYSRVWIVERNKEFGQKLMEAATWAVEKRRTTTPSCKSWLLEKSAHLVATSEFCGVFPSKRVTNNSISDSLALERETVSDC